MQTQEAVDRLEIHDLLSTWADTIDTGVYDDYESLFTPDAVIDFSSIGSTGTDPASHKDFLENIGWPATQAQQHLIGNVQFVAYDGDTASTRCACNASIVMNDGSFVTICVWYLDDLKKVDGRWLIAKRVCVKNFFHPDAWTNPAQEVR